MSDDLDDLLRRALKTLDGEAPSGYFDALPKRTLSRLESSMETSASSGKGTVKESSGAIASAAPLREDDSGLHDLRSLAQSTKVRMSSRRITAQPTNKTDEDILASTSAGWKAVALPEPAQMVSLPALDQLPSKREVLAKERGVIAPAPAAAPKPTAEGTRPVAKARGSNRAVISVVGSGLAVAAGAVIFFATRQPATQDVASTTAAATPAALPTAQAPGAGSSAAAPRVEPLVPAVVAENSAAAGSGSAVAEGSDASAPADPAVAAATPPPPTAHVTTDRGHAKVASGKATAKGDKTSTSATTGGAVAAPAPAPTTQSADAKADSKKPKDEIEDLLSQAGAEKPKQPEKIKPDNKSLSGADFKTGMAGIAGKAQACYKGTQGTVSVKLTVAPSGKVSRAAVTGEFAGKPEGDCVQNAVKNASFPAWDGGPQSFNYSYLLTE